MSDQTDPSITPDMIRAAEKRAAAIAADRGETTDAVKVADAEPKAARKQVTRVAS